MGNGGCQDTQSLESVLILLLSSKWLNSSEFGIKVAGLHFHIFLDMLQRRGSVKEQRLVVDGWE